MYTFKYSLIFFQFSEPGFYQDGEFGIRIENLVKVVTANPENTFKDRKFCTFENLTFVPIQKKMIIAEMLTREEVYSILYKCSYYLNGCLYFCV